MLLFCSAITRIILLGTLYSWMKLFCFSISRNCTHSYSIFPLYTHTHMLAKATDTQTYFRSAHHLNTNLFCSLSDENQFLESNFKSSSLVFSTEYPVQSEEHPLSSSAIPQRTRNVYQKRNSLLLRLPLFCLIHFIIEEQPWLFLFFKVALTRQYFVFSRFLYVGDKNCLLPTIRKTFFE